MTSIQSVLRLPLCAALAALSLLCSSAALAAQPGDSTRTGAPTLHAVRLSGELRVDGELSEPAWAAAPVGSDFVQTAPNPGASASQRTEARVLYTSDAIYVAMRMYDTAPDSIAAQLARRDAGGIYSDWAHVLIDSYNDRRTAFRFSVNPKGVKRDTYHFNDTNEDSSWDAVWDVATRVDSLGWTAEFRIPLSQLRFSSTGSGELSWGINFGREIARYEERAYWSRVEPSSGRFVSFAGELRGLRGLPSPRQLEVQPYVVTRYTRAPGDAANPFYEKNSLASSFGGDLKYGVTSDLTLTATINPDFGQVEADPSEVNLTAYESFLSERRPFFQEGTDIFRFDLGQVDVMGGDRLFYSRRIGRAPQRRVSVDGYVDAPEVTNILGAAKLSGKTKGGWSIGALSAVTAPEEARVFTRGVDTTYAVEPLSSYSMARLSRNFRQGRSAVGGVFTAVNRGIEEGSGLDFLRSAAYAGGFDGRHRFGGGRYEVSGWVMGSHVEGSRRAIQLTQRSSARYFQRPDADHLTYDSTRTSLQGLSANLEIGKISGGNWRWGVESTLRTPGFEVNDLGFMRSADAATVLGGITRLQNKPGPVFRNYRVELAGGSNWTTGGERTLTAAVLNGGFQLRNLWGGGGAVIRLLPAVSPAALRGGPALYTPARTVAFFGMGSDSRKSVRVGLDGSLELEDGTGAHSVNLSPDVTFRPSTRASISVSPTVARNESAWQFLTRQRVSGEDRYVGGHLEQTTLALTTRLSYSFTPDLSLQLYAQPFVSAGDYSGLREVVDPKATDFDQRFRPIAESRLGYNPDFNFKQLRSNAVLRWEYRPGSTLFVAWSQGRTDYVTDGSFGLGRDFGRLLGLDRGHPVPATNALLIKMSYWLDH